MRSLVALPALATPSCERAAPEPAPAANRAAPAQRRAGFRPTLADGAHQTPLRGLGSETMHLPPGARVRATAQGAEVTAGDGFALVVAFDSPPLSELAQAAELTPTQLAFRDDTTLAVGSDSGYAALVVRELVPEWDESDVRRISCATSGWDPTTADKGARYAKRTVERVVASCRSLALPQLH